MATQTVQQMFVGGNWQPSASGETFEATSPATGELIGTVPQGDRGDAQRAIDAARGAADGWARLTAFERAAKMHAIGDLIEARRDDLARTLTLDQGKPMRAEAFDEVDELVEYWRMAAEDAKRLGGELPNSFSPGKRVMLVRRPRGVVGVISPWNWPYTMPAELIAPALACGNAVVWTPAPSTAVCAVALAECIADADLPPGVFNLVTGPGPVVGDEIARNPGTNGVAFIGSTATGRLVAQAAAGKAALLEMGGNGPLVVMDDANIDAAVDATLTACYLCAGQSCTAGERILVHRAVRDEFVEMLARRVTERILLGDPFDDATTMGPVNNEPVAAKMDEHVAGRSRPRRERGHRRRARRRVRHAALLAADGPHRRPGRRARRGRGDVRADRPGGRDRLARGCDRAHQRLALRPARRRSSPPTSRTDSSSPTGSTRAGSTSTSRATTGRRTSRSAAAPGTDSGIGRVGGSHVMQSFTELQTVVLSPHVPGA